MVKKGKLGRYCPQHINDDANSGPERDDRKYIDLKMRVRKTITIFTLCLAALLPLCLSGFFIAGRIIIRITMLEKMEKDELQTISIPTDQIQWYKKNHELIIDGKMFDVKSIQSMWVIPVSSPVFLMKKILHLHEALAGMHEQKNKGQNNSLLLYQVCLGIIAEKNQLKDHIILKDSGFIKLSFTTYEDDILYAYRPVFSPPPESVLG